VVGLTHCRPIISVDDTFLTGKYKCTLMVYVGIIAKNHLLSLAFALVESENNQSWSWFLALVKKEVIGPSRSICMISYRHRDLLNDAKEPLEGTIPLYTDGVYIILPQIFGRSNEVRKLLKCCRHCASLRRRRNLKLD
jgi:hypothetical protein